VTTATGTGFIMGIDKVRGLRREVFVEDFSVGVGGCAFQFQDFFLFEYCEAGSDGDGVSEDVILVDEVVLDQGAYEIGAAVNDDVFSGLFFQRLDGGGEIAVLRFEVSAADGGLGATEGDFAVVYHELCQRLFRGAGLVVDDIFPMVDEAAGHFTSEQDGVAACGEVDDVLEHGFIALAG
jgi:hypothetical protein